MSTKLKESAQQFQNKLLGLGYSNQVVELPSSTRTAKEAAEAIGCDVEHIAKSIIFRLKNTNQALLVVASGKNRINERRISGYVDDKIKNADANFVREKTGFVIGGVPPLGHKEKVITLIDEDLFQYETIWAAAGHPMAVFQLTPDELVTMTGGRVVSVK
ncbi:YbaK/EbsC family protein [Pseudogracilibacillus sp. SO30301A]|uniref:YbaK/EbsC family protein n=1 Tax=Pseudogracilibacillus sp. SO30301A TaxID=3098291 RepID=UPI00300DFC42